MDELLQLIWERIPFIMSQSRRWGDIYSIAFPFPLIYSQVTPDSSSRFALSMWSSALVSWGSSSFSSSSFPLGLEGSPRSNGSQSGGPTPTVVARLTSSLSGSDAASSSKGWSSRDSHGNSSPGHMEGCCWRKSPKTLEASLKLGKVKPLDGPLKHADCPLNLNVLI